ncbi:hypothetical protein SDC9_196150 [bioreactor metagenome]|uniref:Uncharacterized protein n=1 Tax=bioreactor metagenome TaxID=1076179 RepID=A0A645IBM2_9ZZZZ
MSRTCATSAFDSVSLSTTTLTEPSLSVITASEKPLALMRPSMLSSFSMRWVISTFCICASFKLSSSEFLLLITLSRYSTSWERTLSRLFRNSEKNAADAIVCVEPSGDGEASPTVSTDGEGLMLALAALCCAL